MVSPEKIQELRAVVDFWKFRVEENKRHLATIVARRDLQATTGRCGHDYMAPIVDMKSRELSDCQRGLRRAQANLGRELEAAGMSPMTTETVPGSASGVSARSRASPSLHHPSP